MIFFFKLIIWNICKDGKFGLEPILFEGQMSSDFLQDLVCNGRSVCSKGCVCFEQNLSCTIWRYSGNQIKTVVFYDLYKKRTLVCLRIVFFDICPVCNHIVNAHSYLGTDKIQTYKKIPVLGESGMFWFTSLYRTVYIQNIMKHIKTSFFIKVIHK
jgi:hypothetical protein